MRQMLLQLIIITVITTFLCYEKFRGLDICELIEQVFDVILMM